MVLLSKNQSGATPINKRPTRQIDYSKLSLSKIISDVDSGQITSLISVGRGYFATASNVGTIKIWEPQKQSPIAIITEDEGIDFMVPYMQKNDIKIVYVCRSVLKCFSVKNMRAYLLLENDHPITSITQNQQQPTVISFGL